MPPEVVAPIPDGGAAAPLAPDLTGAEITAFAWMIAAKVAESEDSPVSVPLTQTDVYPTPP
jgi:hypothetical protein